jgi:hypothetical protein
VSSYAKKKNFYAQKQILMIKNLLSLTCMLVGIAAFAQPELTSWMMNTTGLAQYDLGQGVQTTNDSADVTMVCYDNNFVYVTAEGMANYVMGPFPNNPNTPNGQDFIWRVKRNPTVENGTKTEQPGAGPLGVAINGVSLYGISDTRSYDGNQNSPGGFGVWNADAWVSEGLTMDASGNGHPQQQGAYHYHANPVSLYSDPGNGHSPLIGFAADGFPIYGPFGYTSAMDNSSGVSRMTSSYQLRTMQDRTTLPDASPAVPPGPSNFTMFPLGTYIEDYEYVNGLGELDEYNGRICVTPEYPAPNGTYAYFISTDGNGGPAFPYLVGLEYYGEVSPTDIGPQAGHANVPGGVTCGTSLAIQERPEEVEIIVFPNPVNDRVTIKLEDGSIPTGILITDLSGRVLKNMNTVNERDLQIDVSDWAEGMYFLSIQLDQTTISKTMAVAH